MKNGEDVYSYSYPIMIQWRYVEKECNYSYFYPVHELMEGIRIIAYYSIGTYKLIHDWVPCYTYSDLSKP